MQQDKQENHSAKRPGNINPHKHADRENKQTSPRERGVEEEQRTAQRWHQRKPANDVATGMTHEAAQPEQTTQKKPENPGQRGRRYPRAQAKREDPRKRG